VQNELFSLHKVNADFKSSSNDVFLSIMKKFLLKNIHPNHRASKFQESFFMIKCSFMRAICFIYENGLKQIEEIWRIKLKISWQFSKRIIDKTNFKERSCAICKRSLKRISQLGLDFIYLKTKTKTDFLTLFEKLKSILLLCFARMKL